jgi:anaerobic magnesium-protoporphyrin IX monomethyl ester cyclase
LGYQFKRDIGPDKFIIMSKVLLINPPFNIAKENYDSSISVGLMSIGTYLASKGVDLLMIDGVRQKEYLALIEKGVSGCRYAGLSVMTMQIPKALEISRLIRKLNPNCKIIWGGSHPTFFTKETASESMVDLTVFGEGEDTMLEIVEGKDPAAIKGLAYKKDGQVIINPDRPLHDPANMPLFSWDLVSREILDNLYLVPSLTSRGCPHQCTFCINAILKCRWRPRTVEQVTLDLKIISAREEFKGKKLRFWDENFFVDLNRSRRIIDGMIENEFGLEWETTVRADYLKAGRIDDEFLAALKRSGCYLLSFGAESGSPKILKKIKKGITPDEIVESARMCLRHGIIPQYSFMIGLPGEDRSDMFKTLDLIGRLLALSDQVQILGPQAFRPYPGSLLYEECLTAGWKAPGSLSEWDELAKNELSYLSVKNFPWVKDKDLVESMEAYVRFGAHSIKSAMGSSVSAPKPIKLLFILICKLRWKLKLFYFPIEFKIAKKYVNN